jgi:hypothetical protein
MKLSLELNYEAYDDAFLQMLYEGYEACYHSFVEDSNKMARDPARYEYLAEDVLHNAAVCGAYEILADHYTAGDSHKRKLQAIRDRIEYGQKLVKGMSNG